MQPLIKWPGGKSSEFAIIKKFIPDYARYIEPFFGGGAVFFNLPPQKALINDISGNLMQFYQYVKSRDEKFMSDLYGIYDEWETLKSSARHEAEKLTPSFRDFRHGNISRENLKNILFECCDRLFLSIPVGQTINLNIQSFRKEILRTVSDKVFRIEKNEIKICRDLSDEDLIDNILTGFTSGYYMYLRSIHNAVERHDFNLSEELKIAVFYFVREFCYGSMFRYNKQGDFNIPYGGIAYNNKDFKKKIDSLFAKTTQQMFENTQIRCEDFEFTLDCTQEDDFIFLDPPYDTDFSDYENHVFREDDQRRLANRLKSTKAKFLLIIKNTPLINELYQNGGYRIYAFDNQYSYCVKGRNDRNAVHLIVTNYD